MTSVSWYRIRLDEMQHRVSREASSKCDRLIEAMNTFDNSHPRFSNWEFSRILVPRLLADLEAL